MQLKNVLLINSVSSGATGLGLIVLSPHVAQIFAVSQPSVFIYVGLFLIVFALLAFDESYREPLRQEQIKLVITLDVSWIIVSFIIVAFKLFNLSNAGYLLIALVAVWVVIMAYLQIRGLKQLADKV